ncbi:MAG TPA: hypothetical protein VI815_03365 [Candidatus Nanoarchaeia archaeon]|nr:hypothetical protein [Candidatus Nanoarchaeia archaeon]
MKIKSLSAKAINDTRGEKTVEISLKTDLGNFIASAPNGKSRGEFEINPWKKNIVSDINAVNKFFIEDINFREFNDLHLIEDSFSDRVGGNTMVALQSAFLKALAGKEDKEVWELVSESIRSKPKKIPFPIGNIIGGGAHSNWKSTVFQEFHLIPFGNMNKNREVLKRGWENAREILSNLDKNFKRKTNDENAWQTTIDDKNIIEVMTDIKENMVDEFGIKVHLGVDVAGSEFFKIKNYVYKKDKFSKDYQIKYMQNLSDKFYYIEDPLEQNDFSGFSEILKKSKSLIVGDDLTASNPERLKLAIRNKSINGVIIKPNQIGSLLKVRELVEICKKNNIKMIFSHRSGETSENIIADVAFGFQSDFVKFGAFGPGRDEKLRRLSEIEEKL